MSKPQAPFHYKGITSQDEFLPSFPGLLVKQRQSSSKADDAEDNKAPSFNNQEFLFHLYDLILSNRDDRLLFLMQWGFAQENLIHDPVLNIVIALGNTSLAVRLIKNISDTQRLEDKNYLGDTALHTAAALNEIQVVEQLLLRKPHMIDQPNEKQETALHKAALNGHRELFWWLVEKVERLKRLERKSSVYLRMKDGATVLHCAIMGNATVLALEIAKIYKDLMMYRDEKGVTPLQLIIKMRDLFRSELCWLEELIYNCIPIIAVNQEDKEDASAIIEVIQGDEEFARAIPGSVHEVALINKFSSLARSVFNPKRAALIGHIYDDHLWKRKCTGWFGKIILHIGRKVSLTVQHLEKDKIKHEEALELVSYLALPRYFVDAHDRKESPLITVVEMGLDECALKILDVCQISSTHLNQGGGNVLQVAVKYRRKKIVKTIESQPEMSWLFTHIDLKTGNTLLHYASEEPETKGDVVFQLQNEIKWFETVKKMVPERLHYRRDSKGKTAKELFSEKHEPMLGKCMVKVADMGKTCSSLLAAVIFASSFEIPGKKYPGTGNPPYFDSLVFKIFSHAYVIGFACAATSLVLYLYLFIKHFEERNFRWEVPITYSLARLSFLIAQLGFIVSFTCNVLLQIYGGQRKERKELIPLLLELAVFPAVSYSVLLCYGCFYSRQQRLPPSRDHGSNNISRLLINCFKIN